METHMGGVETYGGGGGVSNRSMRLLKKIATHRRKSPGVQLKKPVKIMLITNCSSSLAGPLIFLTPPPLITGIDCAVFRGKTITNVSHPEPEITR